MAMSVAQVAEIVPFLRDSRPDLRKAAANTCMQLAATEEGRLMLYEAGAVPWLCKLVGDVDAIAKDSITALINTGADVPAATEQMVNSGIVNSVMEVVVDQSQDCTPRRRDLCLTLLANVTTTEPGVERMLQLGGKGGPEGLHVRRLARALVTTLAAAEEAAAAAAAAGGGGGGGSSGGVDQWQHAASLLCNVTREETGRQILARADTGVLEDLLPQLRSAVAARRRGISGCIRNLCFDAKLHPRLLDGARVLPHVLRGLASSRDAYSFQDKVALDPMVWRAPAGEGAMTFHEREPDAETRGNLLEALQLLCAHPESCAALRKQATLLQGTYCVVRETARRETDERLLVACHAIATALAAPQDAAAAAPTRAAAAAATTSSGSGSDAAAASSGGSSSNEARDDAKRAAPREQVLNDAQSDEAQVVDAEAEEEEAIPADVAALLYAELRDGISGIALSQDGGEGDAGGS
ncbi:hypothetical protein JKP88DRAFT_347047 [Tribonema minus]|uniref:Protein HGH1 N-terminal domain-containing protein n=1 Tax=Tribonema minus TaxID=303371 RepID=A0A835YVT2_9STRA|nr:hypothetical protein JKP88DRAFT_347047 [Tribonema minus]